MYTPFCACSGRTAIISAADDGLDPGTYGKLHRGCLETYTVCTKPRIICKLKTVMLQYDLS
jgi:hypothetical protein